MNDDNKPETIEARIAARPAPKVTPADIEAEIASEHYFTARDGAVGAAAMDWHVDSNEALAEAVDHSANNAPEPLSLLTFCVLVLRNGTKIVGINYGAIDPALHDSIRGRADARADATRQVWPLLGFRLRDRLHAQAQFDAEPKTGEQAVLTDADAAADLAGTPRPDNPSTGVLSNLPAHQQRMRDERDELSQRIYRLKAFFGSETFNALEEDERFLMEDQLEHMEKYLKTLQERIAIFFNAQQNA